MPYDNSIIRWIDLNRDGEIDDEERAFSDELRENGELAEFGPYIIESNNAEPENPEDIPSNFGPWVVWEWDHPDVILGTPSDDQRNEIYPWGEEPEIIGTEGRDWIFGGNGDDYIQALGGDDNIDGGRGEDVIIAGDGDDIIGSGMDGDRDVFDFADNDGGRDALHIHRAFEGGSSGFGYDTIMNASAEDQIWIENGLNLVEIQSDQQFVVYSITDSGANHLGFLEVQGDWQAMDVFNV